MTDLLGDIELLKVGSIESFVTFPRKWAVLDLDGAGLAADGGGVDEHGDHRVGEADADGGVNDAEK